MFKTSAARFKISEPMAILAHQLKNPLAGVKFYIEAILLEEIGPLNERQREYLNDLLRNAQRMAGMVNDILDIAKIETNEYSLRIQPIDLVKVTEEVIGAVSSWSGAANTVIIFNKPDSLPLVATDPVKIYGVIENLISNAFKYKMPGRGKIEITIRETGDKVLFICKDNGIGITPEDSRKIFSKFFRSKRAMSIESAGTGLGLYIDNAVIGLSGGKIWFEANKDIGTSFYFTLPAVAKD